MADNELLIEIKASAKEFVEALEIVKHETGELENQLKVMSIVSGAAFATFTVEVGLATEAYAKQEAATNALSASLQSQGMYTKELVERYRETAEAIERKTGVDAEAIVSGMALAQSMIGQIPITKELTQGVVDLAARTGMDMKEAFKEVAKAVNGHSRGLKLLGVEVDDTADRQTRLRQITEGLKVQFGGAAEAANQGLGSYKGLEVAFEALQKKIGAEFAPVITSLISTVTHLFQAIADNKALVDFIVSVTAAGVVVGGMATAVSLGGLAFFKLKEALEVAKIGMTAMEVATKGLIGATGIGLILIIVSELYLNWNTVWPAMKGVFEGFVNNISSLAAGLGKLLFGVFTIRPDDIKSGLEQIKAAFSAGAKDFEEITAKSHEKQEKALEEHEERQNKTQKKAADLREQERRFQDAQRIAAAKAESDLLTMEIERESAAAIALKKEEAGILVKLESEKYKKVREELKEALEQNRAEQARQKELDLYQEKAYDDELSAQSEAYRQLTEQQQRDFDNHHQNDLQAQIQNERTTREKAAQDQITAKIKEHNQLLADEQKFGKGYAQINKLMHTEIFQGTKTAFADLQQLQSSHNETLRAIGKAAAIANVVIKTAESAMNIYAGFSTIPFIGPALGAVGAAAAVAFGAEQIGQITAAADGGLIEGGIPGKDSVRALLMPGELVTPRKNFDEVVNAVASQRSAQGGGASPVGEQTVSAHVELSLKDELAEVVEAKIIKRQRLGISLIPKFT